MDQPSEKKEANSRASDKVVPELEKEDVSCFSRGSSTEADKEKDDAKSSEGNLPVSDKKDKKTGPPREKIIVSIPIEV